MIISGLEPLSLVDYPGKLACVLFTGGCNFLCRYCHNRPHLVEGAGQGKKLFVNEILSFLKRRRGLLDAVVVSGGEPTIHEDLEELLLSLSNLGFLVKLDTNGSKPEVVEQIMKKRLADYIALDLKAPAELLPQVVGVDVRTAQIHRTIELLMTGGVEYEFRTTVLPEFTSEHILQIGRSIQGAKRYVLQEYRKPGLVSSGFSTGRRDSQAAARIMAASSKLMQGWFGELLCRNLSLSGSEWNSMPDLSSAAA